MKVVKDDPTRVLRLDFDRAQIYEHFTTPRRQELIEFEDALTAELLKEVVSRNMIYLGELVIDILLTGF